jgi:hypothetical protein
VSVAVISVAVILASSAPGLVCWLCGGLWCCGLGRHVCELYWARC